MAERNNTPPRMTALGLLEQMRRANANREAPFDPIAAAARERRAGPTAPLFGGQRQPPLPIPPRPPAVIPPQQTQRAAPQAAAAPQARTPAQALPVPPRPPQLDAEGNPIYTPPALLPQVPGAPRLAMHERFNPENPYVATATQMAERYGLPPNVFLSLIQRESRFRPDAVSRVGALGLGQLMPGTARDLRVDPLDPTENIEGSARYLRQQLDRFGGDMTLALAAYNAGPRRVAEAGNTIPNNKETRAYVPTIMRNAGVPGYAEGGLAHLEQKYAEGGRVRRVIGAARRAVTPEPEAARIPPEPTRSVFPAPQRFFDPEDRAYKSSLQNFEYEPGGRYLEMRRGETPRDITGESVDNARISVGPSGRPSMMVGEPTDLPTGSPGRGSTATKTNLFKRSAGWKWTDAPEGYADIPTLVSVENRNQHYYALSADYPRGVDLSRYPASKQEPRLRPTTQGNVYPGNQVGTISVRGREHPVYDNVTVRQMAPAGMVGAAAASGEDDAPASLEHLEQKYSEGGSVTSLPTYDIDVRATRIPRRRAPRPAPREELTADQLNAMVLDILARRAAAASEAGAAAEARERIGRTMGYAEGGLADLHQKYADGGEVMSDEEYDRRLLERMKRDTGRTTESTNAEQARALRSAGYDAAQLASDIFMPQSPLDAALMVAFGPGGRMARLAGSTALMAMEPSEAEAGTRFVRRSKSFDSPFNRNARHIAMFAETKNPRETLDMLKGYGPAAWISRGDDAVDVRDIQPDIVRALRNSGIHDDYNTTAAALARNANPENIVNSAGLWDDPRLVREVYENIIQPREITSVRTNDGLLVFDPVNVRPIRTEYAQGGLAQLHHKYAEGGAVSAQPAIYDPDAVNALANQIEADYV